MRGVGNIKGFCIFVFLICSSLCFNSCGPKVYPSGIEHDLMGYTSGSKRNERQRERDAKREIRAKKKLTCKALRGAERVNKEKQKELNLLAKKHFEKQDQHVQERMKKNMKRTKRFYTRLRTQEFVKKVLSKLK